MRIEIETPHDEPQLREFVDLFDRVYEHRPARWEASGDLWLPVLMGEGPFVKDRDLCPFVARQSGKVVARVLALVDSRYIRHWNERLGHLVWFEAMPETREAVQQMMDAACAWLAERNVPAARTGGLIGLFDMPFAIDTYDVLPPSFLRQNPAYYHGLIKRAGFETEKGFVDYKLEITPALETRWRSALEGARRAGFQILPLREVPADRRVHDFTDTLNESFRTHWGWTPFAEDEVAGLFEALEEVGNLDTSVLAYDGEGPVGVFFAPADNLHHVRLAPGRELQGPEKLNAVGIGVRERARGRGVNYAMAGYSFLELAKRARTHLSYTLVLDDNWPSRRTGEGLGCELCGNYVAYRRNFRRA
jgi:hypothetical protein